MSYYQQDGPQEYYPPPTDPNYQPESSDFPQADGHEYQPEPSMNYQDPAYSYHSYSAQNPLLQPIPPQERPENVTVANRFSRSRRSTNNPPPSSFRPATFSEQQQNMLYEAEGNQTFIIHPPPPPPPPHIPNAAHTMIIHDNIVQSSFPRMVDVNVPDIQNVEPAETMLENVYVTDDEPLSSPLQPKPTTNKKLSMMVTSHDIQQKQSTAIPPMPAMMSNKDALAYLTTLDPKRTSSAIDWEVPGLPPHVLSLLSRPGASKMSFPSAAMARQASAISQFSEATSAASDAEDDLPTPLARQFPSMYSGMRHVYMAEHEDALLFDTILSWKQANPEATSDDAHKMFGNLLTSSDAIINILYDEWNCDYILKFDNQSNAKKQHVRERFERRILQMGMFLEYEESKKVKGEFYIKVTSPFHCLCVAAEIYKLRLPVKEPQVKIPQEEIEKANKKLLWLADENEEPLDLNLHTVPFRRDELRNFRNAEEELEDYQVMTGLFKPFFRALLTKFMLDSIQIHVKDGDSLKGQKHGLSFLVAEKYYTAYYYQHERLSPKAREKPTLRELVYDGWVRRLWHGKNLKNLRNYFGEKLALHFAFCLFYRKWLNVIAIFGVAVFAYGVTQYLRYTGTEERPWRRIYDNNLATWFSLVLSFWSTFFLEFWKRRNTFLAYVWSTDTLEAEEKTRYGFKPTEMKLSLVTGVTEPNYPRRIKRYRQLESFLVILVFMAITAVSVVGQIFFTLYLKNNTQFTSIVISILTSLLGLVMVRILKATYEPTSRWLNNRENHRTHTQYDDSLIIKNWMFDFVNVFSRLVYLAFVRKQYVNTGVFGNKDFSNPCQGDCTTDVFIQVIFLFVGDLVVGRLLEYGFPLISKFFNYINFWRKKQNAVATELKPDKYPQYYYDDKLPPADNGDADYMQKISQFGLLTAFSVIFPLAPVVALLNNSVEIHTDSYKYLKLLQRVPPVQAQDMGTWFSILKFYSIVAVSVNAGLVVFTYESFSEFFIAPFADINQDVLGIRLIYFTLWHVSVLGICQMIAFIVPDVPTLVQIAKRRHAYLEKMSGLTQFQRRLSFKHTDTAE